MVRRGRDDHLPRNSAGDSQNDPTYQNFELKADFGADDTMNSAIFVRCPSELKTDLSSNALVHERQRSHENAGHSAASCALSTVAVVPERGGKPRLHPEVSVSPPDRAGHNWMARSEILKLEGSSEALADSTVNIESQTAVPGAEGNCPCSASGTIADVSRGTACATCGSRSGRSVAIRSLVTLVPDSVPRSSDLRSAPERSRRRRTQPASPRTPACISACRGSRNCRHVRACPLPGEVPTRRPQ